MAWREIFYTYPNTHIFQKQLLWLNKDANIYFGMRAKEDNDWTYFAGDTNHALVAGSRLTQYGTEANAQVNYLTTTRDATTGKFIALLPSNIEARYVKLFVASGSAVTIYEWWPSTYLSAHEIVSGQLLITDALSDAPSIKIEISGQERGFWGNLGSGVYGLRGRDASGNIIFQLDSDNPHPYVDNYADHKAIELELMKMNFQQISWAQFAIFDAFDDETKRMDPDPSTYPARVYQSKLDNGEDNTPLRSFGFVAKIYTDITTIDSGTSTSVGSGFLEDTSKAWFIDELKNTTLKDSAGTDFTVNSTTSNRLNVTGTPAAGAYTVRDDDPQYCVTFCSLSDSTNGGSGYVKLEIGFNGWTEGQTIYDTINVPNVDLRQATMAIAYPGHDYLIRITLKNDAAGNGPVVYKWLLCTDPAPWRF